MTISPLNDAAAAYLAAETQSVDAQTVEGQTTDGQAVEVVPGAPHSEYSRLLALQCERGSVPKAEYEAAERALGLSRRQIQRTLARLRVDGQVPTRQSFELSTHHKQVIMACNGNVALAYRELEAAGEELPHLDTFWRAWNRQPTGIQAYARKGAQGLVRFWLYPP